MVLFSPTRNVNSPRLRFGAVLLAAGSSEPVVHGWCSVNGCWVTDWMESPQCLLCIPTTQSFILFHPDNFNNLLTVSLPTNPRPFTCPWLVLLFGNIFFYVLLCKFIPSSLRVWLSLLIQVIFLMHDWWCPREVRCTGWVRFTEGKDKMIQAEIPSWAETITSWDHLRGLQRDSGRWHVEVRAGPGQGDR